MKRNSLMALAVLAALCGDRAFLPPPVAAAPETPVVTIPGPPRPRPPADPAPSRAPGTDAPPPGVSSPGEVFIPGPPRIILDDDPPPVPPPAESVPAAPAPAGPPPEAARAPEGAPAGDPPAEVPSAEALAPSCGASSAGGVFIPGPPRPPAVEDAPRPAPARRRPWPFRR